MKVMKKLAFFTLITLGMLLAAACENEPHLVVSYITSPAMKAKISEELQGTYSGKLIVVMDDTTSHVMHNEAGTWERKAYVDSLLDFKYMVSPLSAGEGPATTHVTLTNFPIRWLARSVSNHELREALKNHADVPLELDFELHGETYNPESHNGYLRAKSLPLELDVTLAGSSHKLKLEFGQIFDFIISADDPTSWSIPFVQMEVSKVILDGVTLEVFDDAWTSTPSPLFLFKLTGKKENND